MTTRLLIADDHGLLRAGLRNLLNAAPDLDVVAEADNGQKTLQLCAEFQPEVVLLDLTMPDMDGIEITRQLKEAWPQIRVLILTAHEEEGFVKAAIRAGASGYIIKRALESELVDAIHAVQAGGLYIHPAMTHALLKDISPSLLTENAPEPSLQDPLTARELEVLGLIADGYLNRQIAEALTISVRTVEGHRAKLMQKLNLHSRLELVRYAKKHGLVK